MMRSPAQKRGQAAVEFLITYGWAILAVLVVLGAVGYFTGFTARMLPDRCDIEAPFSCLDHKVMKDGTGGTRGIITLQIHNGAGVDLDNVYVELWCGQDRSTAVSALFPLVRDQERINDTFVRFSCPLDGSAFKTRFFVTYAESGASTNHTVNGELRTTVE